MPNPPAQWQEDVADLVDEALDLRNLDVARHRPQWRMLSCSHPTLAAR
ncbi:MAG: hypothetical protein M3N26_11345 [Pseudomonadota bacterium]|nr:hypothetical protein [Pseudomonadota bacterium]